MEEKMLYIFVISLIIGVFGVYLHFTLNQSNLPSKARVDQFFAGSKAFDRHKVEIHEKGLLSLPLIIGHKGVSVEAPPNTLEAVRMAHRLGADAVEIDVVMTADHKLVLMHDLEVDQTTNSTGAVRSFTLQELQTLDAAHNHPKHDDYPFVQIPTVHDIVKFCLENDLKIFFDVKDFSNDVIQKFIAMFHQNPILYEKAIICSFSFNFLVQIRKMDPQIIIGATYRPRYNSHISATGPIVPALADSYFLGKYGVARFEDLMMAVLFYYVTPYWLKPEVLLVEQMIASSPKTVEYMRGMSRYGQLAVWTVNEWSVKEWLIQQGCAYITDTLTVHQQ